MCPKQQGTGQMSSKLSPEASNHHRRGSAVGPAILSRHLSSTLFRAVEAVLAAHSVLKLAQLLSSSPGLLFQGMLCLGGDMEVVQQRVSEGRISLQALGPCPQRVKVAGSWVNFHRMRHSPVATQHF